MYEPRPLSEPPGAAAAALANHAWQNRLTIYAGAGMSAAEPTFLPGANGLARLITDALSGQISLGGVDCDDLVAVADAVASQPMGEDLFRQTIFAVADLRGARVNYAHEVLALLLCEGAATVLETNYDDCIERAAQPEVPSVVRTTSELLHSTGAMLLKVHGCASRPETMLVTAAQLASAPRWATIRTAAQLNHDRVAFIGIGSPAAYVRDSVSELLKDIDVGHILLVDPATEHWDDEPPSPWRQLLPSLPAGQRDGRSAEEFCDALMRAYLVRVRTSVRGAVEAMAEGHGQRVGLGEVIRAMEQMDGVKALRWLREASHKLAPGVAVATSAVAVAGLLALGALVGANRRLRFLRRGLLLVRDSNEDAAREADGEDQAAPQGLSGGVPVMLLAVHGAIIGTVAQAEARQRVRRAREEDLVQPGELVVVVAVRHMGPMSAEVEVNPGDRLADVLARAEADSEHVLPENVVAKPDAAHVIDGVSAGAILFVDGDDLIEAAA